MAEHIAFFGRLKALHKSEIAAEIQLYVELLQLEDKNNAQAKTLVECRGSCLLTLRSTSTQRLSCVTSPHWGWWDLLLAEKKEHTILLSTHFVDEADILGDRIAIMSNGELKAVGSSFYLKKNFGIGYRLVCVKTKKCETQKVTNLFRKYVTKVKVDTGIGTELSYQLEPKPVVCV